MMISSATSRPPAGPTATGPVEPLRRIAWPALGTECVIQFAGGDPAAVATFGHKAIAWVAQFEQRYSRFRPDSLVSRINAAAGQGWTEVDAEMEQMLELSAAVHFMTQGVLDVTALPLIRLWNFKAATPRIPSDEEIAQARRKVGWSKVQRAPGKVLLPEPGMALDFGGWAKEFAVDAVAQMAREHGIPSVLVDFGHDLRASGLPPGKPAWHIGLEDPAQPGATWGSLGITDAGVASSGDYLRSFTLQGKRYGHILDPRSGWPVANGLRQATVVAATCFQAGLLSTAAFVLGPEAGLRLIQGTFGAEGCLVGEKTRHQTRGFYRYVVETKTL